MNTGQKICNRCIMDTTDPYITFDENGYCNHCNRYFKLEPIYKKNTEAGKRELDELIAKMKKDGEGKKYDCIIGVSGGVDSTFVAYQIKNFGLRPLAVHLDNGWNSELAVSNIEKTLNILGIDLYTHVLDWEEFKSLQLAFLYASTPDGEIPTDHAILATLFKVANKMKIKYLISGQNFSSEAIGVKAWSYGHSDWRYIYNINKQFGMKKLKTFPHFTFFDLLYYRILKGQRAVRLLDYIDYDKEKAIEILKNQLGWEYYGGKHYESIYTRFFQGYILPQKFGFDKRKAHLSTLICSQQISRENALAQLQEPIYPSQELLEEDKEFVIKKLGINHDIFNGIMSKPPQKFDDYPSYETHFVFKWFKVLYQYLSNRTTKIKRWLGF